MKYWIMDCFDEDAPAATSALIAAVQPFLNLGWKPVGGVALTYSPHGKDFGYGVAEDGWWACQARMDTATGTIGKPDQLYVRECTEYLVQQGFLVEKKGMPFASDFYTEVEAALGKAMPSLQPFINECFARGAETATFGQFAEYCARYLPLDVEMKSNALRGYLIRSDFNAWKDNKRVDTFRDLLRITWNDRRLKTSIQRHNLFAPLMDGERAVPDSSGNKILLFNQPKKGGTP